MKRLTEELKQIVVLPPQTVAADTPTTSGYVDLSGVPEIVFAVAAGALAEGKALTVTLLTSDSEGGSGAKTVHEQVFTADSRLTAPMAVMSYKPDPYHGRYAALCVEHDAEAAVSISVTAQLRQREIPVENPWCVQV